MRPYFAVLLLSLAFFSAGCGSGNGENIAKNTLAIMKELTDAFEKGDKESILSLAKKLQAQVKESKETKISQSENQRITEKYKPQVEEQAKKMMAAMMKAMTSGKLKQEDMQEIGKIMQEIK